MKLSLFTPTHRPSHLHETYSSLLRQTCDVPWEWIIVPNGPVRSADLPRDIVDDPHISVHEYPSNAPLGIGALKRFACAHCTGDVFIELDHDDLLASNAFEEISKALTLSPNCFIYSDYVNFKPDGTCETYGEKFGWEKYRCEVDGKKYTAMRAFPPSARSMSQIYYAPNHVRAWSREAYRKSGGHDDSLPVCDDHDLVCRTYLTDTPFHHITKPIYLYRRYQQNTFVSQAVDIKRRQQDVQDRYLHQLVEAECRRNLTVRLDLGMVELADAGWEIYDLVANHFNPLSAFKSNSVGCVRAFNVLHGVPPDRLTALLNDLHRTLIPGGWLLTATPSPEGQVIAEPARKALPAFSPAILPHLTQKRAMKRISGLECPFQEVRSFYTTIGCKRLHFADLCALKGQRQPGKHGFS